MNKTFNISIPRKAPSKPIEGYIDENNCWLCTSHKKDRGYPRLTVCYKQIPITRFLWKTFRGNIPENMFVCHTCDNPACINLDHLFLGSPKDNMHDKVLKNRHVVLCGEQSPSSKLTSKQVLDIRNDKRSHHLIAKDYGVHRRTIGLIKNKQRWKHV